MKYNALALAPVLMASADALLSLNVDFKLPLGIELPISVDVGPKNPPPEDCISIWHPPHHGVDMDGCDDDGHDGWHWVHPGRPHRPHQPAYVWTTLTVTATHVNTVTDCPPGVQNCPNRQTAYTTVVVPETTTICPVPVTDQYIPPPATTNVYVPPPVTTNVYVPPVVTTSETKTKTSWTKTWDIKTSRTKTPWTKTWEAETSWTKTPGTKTPWTKTWVHSVSTPVPQPPPVQTPCYTCEYPTGNKPSHPPVSTRVSTPVWTPNQPHTPVTPVTPVIPGTSLTPTIPVTPVTPGNPGTPVSPPRQTTPAYPPPAGYTTVPSTGQPGYCPGPGCPSFSTVGTVTRPVQQTPTSPVVVVNGGAALDAHVRGLFAVVAAAAALF